MMQICLILLVAQLNIFSRYITDEKTTRLGRFFLLLF